MANKTQKKRKQKKVNINGKRISINYYTESEFSEKFRKLLLKEEEIKKTSFSDIAEKWQSTHDDEVQKYTQECYKAPVKDVISWFGNRPISDILPLEIQEHINDMGRQGYAKQTINLRKIVINQIFNYAVLNGYVKYNPVLAVKVPKSAPKLKRELPEKEALKKIIENVDKHFGFYFLIIATTGIRRGEACALKKEDFDFNKNIVNINKVCILSDNTKPVIRDGTKSESGNRSVPILPFVKDVIKKYVKSSSSEYVISYNGEPLVKWQFDKLSQKYKKETGLEFTSHQLRHLYATICYDSGLDVKDTQMLLGHSKASTTEDIYIHIRESRKEAVNKKLMEQISIQFKQESQ